MTSAATPKKTGFQRLRGLAAASLTATAGLLAGSARAVAPPASFPAGGNVYINLSNGGTGGITWRDVGGTSPSSRFSIGNASSSTTYTYTYTSSTPSGGTSTWTTTSSSIYSSAFDGFFSLQVNDTWFVNPDGSLNDNIVVGGRSISSDTVSDIAPDIDASIEYRFYGDRRLVRALFTLTNTGTETRDVSALIAGALNYGDNITVQATSDSDTTAEQSDSWLMLNASSLGSDPSWQPGVLLQRFGDAGLRPTAQTMLGAGENNEFGDKYRLRLAPGATARIMLFAELSQSNATLLAAADDYASLSSLDTAGLISDLSVATRDSIVNYNATVTGVSKPAAKDDDEILGSVPVTLLLGLGLLALRRRTSSQKA